MPLIRTVKTTVVLELEHRSHEDVHLALLDLDPGIKLRTYPAEGSVDMVIRSVTHDYLH